MRFRNLTGAFSLVLAFALPAPAAEPVIKMLWASPFTLPFPQDVHGRAAPARIPLPVALGGKRSPAHICVETVGVRAQSIVDEMVAKQFSVEPRLGADANAVPTITVVVREPMQLPPGTYELALRAIDCMSKSARLVLETLNLTFTRPAAKLEPTGKVTVDQWLTTPWSPSASAVIPDRIKLRATAESKSIPLGLLRADAGPFTSAGTSINVGSWKVDAAKAQVPTGEVVEIALAPSGFPVGTASGRFELSGRDLQAAQSIDVELRTRLVAGWIPLVVGLGALVGFLLRVKLQQVIDIGKARKPGFDELMRVRTEVGNVGDAQFRATVEPRIVDLERALKGDDVAAIATASTTVRSALDTANSALKEALKAVAKRIDALRNEFGTQAPLPAALKQVCETAVRLANGAANAVARSDAGLATQTLDSGVPMVKEAFDAAWSATRADLEETWLALGTLAPLLSRVQRERLAEALDKRKAATEEVKSPDDVVMIGHRLREMLDWLARALVADSERSVREAKLRVATPGDLDTTGQEFVASCSALAKLLELQRQWDSGFARADWGGATERATNTMGGLLAQVVQLLAEDIRKSLPADLARLPLDEALAKIPLDNPTFGTPQAESYEGPALTQTDGPGAGAQHEPQIVPDVGMSLGAIKGAQRSNFLSVAHAEALMAFGIILVLVIVCFGFYAERFVGTWPELLGLFFIGFSADLGADKLVSKVKELGVKA